jgi:CBS domain-containing protein
MLVRITEAESAQTLREIRDQTEKQLMAASSPEDPEAYTHIVNELHDAYIRRAVQLAESELKGRGLGTPPVPYSFLLFGSGGRKEQTLWSDQDNGIVYRDPDDLIRKRTEQYFEALSACIVSMLEALGYPPCDGGVLCSNSMWRQPLSRFTAMVDGWLNEPHWESMRYILVVSDMRSLHGDSAIAASIKTAVSKRIAEEPALLHHMLKNTLHRKVALGLFGQLFTERYGEAAGGVEVKYGVYIPIVNAVRLLAVQARLNETSTLGRLQLLAERELVPAELADDWREAFVIALKMRTIANGIVPADKLTSAVKRELKLSLHVGDRLQKYVRHRIEKEAK